MKTSVIIQNLKCGGCAHTIKKKLSELKNITDLKVDVATSKVSFEYENIHDALAVKQKLKAIGYPSIDSENSITTKAKSFFSCAAGKVLKP